MNRPGSGKQTVTVISDERPILSSFGQDESVRGLAAVKDGVFTAATEDKTVVSAVKLLNSMKAQLDSRPRSAEPSMHVPDKLPQSHPPKTSQPRISKESTPRRTWDTTSKFPAVFSRHTSSNTHTAPDTFKPLPLHEMTETVSAARSAESEREQSLEWLAYWGNLRHLRSEQATLVTTVCSATTDIARLTSDRESLSTQLQWAMGHVKDLEAMITQERQESATALAIERNRHDSLASENDRLKNKVSEMRYQVTLAENALHKLRLESDAAQLTAATMTSEVEQLRLKSNVEIMQLKKEIVSATFSTEKQARLEHLEQETTRQAEQVATLFKTVDLVKADNKALHERLQTATMPSVAVNRSGAAIDAGSIQQLAQKQFHKVEQELTELVATLRHQNDRSVMRTTGMKNFLQRGVRALEMDLLLAHDVDANNGSRFVMKQNQLLIVKPRKGAGPPTPQYTIAPLVFMTPGGSSVMPTVTDALIEPIVSGLNEIVWKDMNSIWSCCKEITEKLWAVVDKVVPMHPTKNPAGEKESLHATVSTLIQKGFASMQRACTRQGELVKELLKVKAAGDSGVAKEANEKIALQQRLDALINRPARATEDVEEAKRELASVKKTAASSAKVIENCVANSKYCAERVSSCLRRCDEEFALPVEAAHVQHVDDAFFEREVPQQVLETFRSIIFAVERHAEALSIQRSQLRVKATAPSASSSPGTTRLIPEIGVDIVIPQLAASNVSVEILKAKKEIEALTLQTDDLRRQNQELTKKLSLCATREKEQILLANAPDKPSTPLPPRTPSPIVTLIPQPYLVDDGHVRSVGVNTDAASRPSSPSGRPVTGLYQSDHNRIPTESRFQSLRPQSPHPEQNVQLVIGCEALAETLPAGHGPVGNREPMHSRAALQPSSLPIAPSLVDGSPSMHRKVRSAAQVHRVRFAQSVPTSQDRSPSPKSTEQKDFSFVPFLTTRRLL